jgi:hypothetical protein
MNYGMDIDRFKELYTNSGSFKFKGCGHKIAGYRPSFIIFDDLKA